MHVQVIFDIYDAPVFNLAFAPSKPDRFTKWKAAGRWYSHETYLMANCTRDNTSRWRRQYGGAQHWDQIAYASEVSNSPDAFSIVEVPASVRCQTVGEPHWISASPQHVYAYTHNDCSAVKHTWRPYWKKHWAAAAGEYSWHNWEKNNFRGYLFNPTHRKPLATFLSYKRRPERANVIAKNFLFFQYGGEVYVVTLFNPHMTYSLDASTGLMNYSFQSTFTPKPRYHKIGLSAGPVRLNSSAFLAAAHESKGGWSDAYRMTVFYVFAASPPFRVLCTTPPISFGFSVTLEYCTSLQQHGLSLYVGIGYNNCYSALVKVSARSILARCLPTEASV
jgi:hypothetical protein